MATRTVSRGVTTLSNFGAKYGPGGRSSNSGMTVTIFGASTGFLGRYVANEFGKRGTRVYIPYRGDDMEYRHLRPMFDLGQAGFIPFSGRDEASMREAIGNSDVVINLLGKGYETKHLMPVKRADGTSSIINYSFDEVHVDIAARIARLSKECGVKRFVHVSAASADLKSPSVWARSKAAGEQAVRSEFSDAIIVRPSRLFGYEDKFLNWLAEVAQKFNVIPLMDGGNALVQPTYVNDVAQAIFKLSVLKGAEGATVALAGPETYTWKEVAEFVTDVTHLSPHFVDMPVPIARTVASVIDRAYQPFFTPDQVIRMTHDEVLPTAAQLDAQGVHTFDWLEMKPTTMEKAAFSYLHRFRPGGHFVEVKGYH